MTSRAADLGTTRHLVELLVARSGLPASPAEIDALVAEAPAVAAALDALWSVDLHPELEPATVFRAR